MNELQMMILELYAGAKDEQELNALMLRDEHLLYGTSPDEVRSSTVSSYVGHSLRATYLVVFEPIVKPLRFSLHQPPSIWLHYLIPDYLTTSENCINSRTF